MWGGGFWSVGLIHQPSDQPDPTPPLPPEGWGGGVVKQTFGGGMPIYSLRIGVGLNPNVLKLE